MRGRTEGIPLSKISLPFLKRNMPPMLADEEDYTNAYGNPQWNEDGLILRVSQDSYRILYDPGTSDWWVHDLRVRKRGLGAYEEVQKERDQKFENLFGAKGVLMRARDGDLLEEENAKFEQWLQNGPSPDDMGLEGAADNDELMGGT